MSRRECWGVYHREKGWFVDEEGREFAHTPVRRASFTLENAKIACEKDEYPRRFWRVKKTKWHDMSDPPDALRAVLVSDGDGVEAVVAYHYNERWYVSWDEAAYIVQPTDKWTDLPTR